MLESVAWKFAEIIGLTLSIMWTFWIGYILVMGVYRAYLSQRLSKAALILSLPIVLIGIILDVLINIFLATFIFLDMPRELLMTRRMIRYRKTDNGWRAKLSQFICDHLLDVFDPKGNHC